MRRYAVVRTLSILPTLFGVSVAVFLLIRLIPGTVLDHVVGVGRLFSLSIPVFWQATMLILAVSLWFGWAPSVEFVSPWVDLRRNLAVVALPSLALGTAVAAVFMRMTRSSLLEVM